MTTTVFSDLSSLELRYLTQRDPEDTYAQGPTGPRLAPIEAGDASVDIDAFVCRQFDRDYRGCRGQHFVLRDCLVFSGHGSDGMVIDADNHIIAETAAFARLNTTPGTTVPEGCVIHEAPVEKVALFFDSAWTNYYHFLLFGIGRFNRFADLLPADVPTLLPAFDHAFERNEVKMARATLDRVLDMTVRTRPTLELAPGAHRVGEVHLFWSDSHPPTDILETRYFLAPFRAMVPAVDRPALGTPKRRLMIRRGGPDPRMGEAEAAMAQSLAQDLGFETLVLENLSFDAQMAAFSQAEAVIAPHGAGLANIVFADPSCLTIELNRRIGGEALLRPWFYQLAALRNMAYAGFDMDQGPAALDDAFRFMRSRL